MSNPNGELARSWFDQVWNAGDERAIDRLMAPGAKLHGLPAPDGGPVVGPAGFRPFYHAFRAAFPDIRVRVLRTICEGDMVACHCVVTGSHRGAGLGVAPSKAPVEIYGVALALIRDGQIQEAWNCFDFLSLYQQVGMLPPLPKA
jgi:predicted ester cyclase